MVDLGALKSNFYVGLENFSWTIVVKHSHGYCGWYYYDKLML